MSGLLPLPPWEGDAEGNPQAGDRKGTQCPRFYARCFDVHKKMTELVRFDHQLEGVWVGLN